MSDFPLEHLSASSIVKFMRCPKQWQDHYLFGRRGPGSAALVIGSATHLLLARRLSGQPEGSWFKDALDTYENGVVWEKKLGAVEAEMIASTLAYHYWEQVAKYLDVVGTELEFNLAIEGVDIPVVGFVDIETTNSNIDIKTTRYLDRKRVKANKEWVLQQGIYQLRVDKPSEIHVLTRAKHDPVVVPDGPSHPLYLGHIDKIKTAKLIRDQYALMLHCWERYGLEQEWPGNPLHEWAHNYCPLDAEGRCCRL